MAIKRRHMEDLRRSVKTLVKMQGESSVNGSSNTGLNRYSKICLHRHFCSLIGGVCACTEGPCVAHLTWKSLCRRVIYPRLAQIIDPHCCSRKLHSVLSIWHSLYAYLLTITRTTYVASFGDALKTLYCLVLDGLHSMHDRLLSLMNTWRLIMRSHRGERASYRMLSNLNYRQIDESHWCLKLI